MNGFAFKAQNTTRAAVSIVSLFVLSLLAVSLVVATDLPNSLECDDSTSPTRAGDWVQDGFDPGHTSFNRFETELSPENVGNLVKLWEADVGLLGFASGAPVVRDGKVYIGSATDNRMYALDAATGATLWVGEPQGSFFGATAAVGHGLVFACAHISPLVAYDAETGEIAWTSTLGGSGAAPTLYGRRLYTFGDDDLVHAVDPETGTEIWSQTRPDGANGGQEPVVLNGRVFQSASGTGGLTAYNAQTGETLWHKNNTGSGAGVVATQGRLFFRGTFEGGSESVIALDAATGELIWETPNLPGATDAIPAVAYGMVFVTFVDLIALDARTGVEVWRAPGVHSNAGPSVANGVVYASNTSGEWDAFDARNGALLWSVVIPGCGGTCTNAIPVVANGRLYLAGPDRFLHAYGLPR